MQKITIFKNFNEIIENVLISDVIERIIAGTYKKQIMMLRSLLAAGKTTEYNEKKKSLTAFTPCGTFSGGRKIDKLQTYSHFVILDIDKLDAKQLGIAKEKTEKQSYTYSVFLSPGGNGLKILVKVSSGSENHVTAFNQVKAYYEALLGVSVDISGKDVSRLCFFSYDPDAYINESAKVFPINTNYPGMEKDIEKVVAQIETLRLDITADYDSWRDVGFALCDALGESGRGYFHRVSRFNGDYNTEICDDQYTRCLNSTNSGITVRTFFFMAKSYGIDISPVERKFSDIFIETPQSKPKEKEKKQKISSNKFRLAKEYLEKNYEIRYNEVSTQFEFREKGTDDFQLMNENSIFVKMQLDDLNISLNNLVAFLKSDHISRYNPFLEYFDSLPEWDKETDYINRLAGFVKVRSEDRTRFVIQFKKWFVRIVKCAIVDDYFNKQAFILIHDKQNSGKSTFCRFLCPQKLSNYIAENPSVDKDSRILLTTNLLINLDELSTLSKVEINSLKSLFSKDKINDRLPYDRRNSILPRRASFIGSTNQTEFLNDESGSVRWLCFIIEEIDWSYKDRVNIDLVYSQAYFLFKANFPCDLTREEIEENEQYNRQFHIVTSEKELIHKYLEHGDSEKYDRFMTSTDILIYLSEMSENRVRMNVNNIGKSLKMLGFQREKNYPDRNYGYYIQFKK